MRIMIADDHSLVREAIASILQSNDFSDVVFAGSLTDAVDRVSEFESFDLILLDYSMPGMNGLDGLSKMIALAGDCPVAILTGVESPDLAHKALELGAAGFIPKTISARSMMSAIKFMADGEKYLPMEFMKAKHTEADGGLSKREMEVLEGICEGKSNKEIAIDLNLQEVTIKLYVKTLTGKLNARNRTHAAMIARDRSLF